jgi:pilus assembly protein FimV
MSVDRNSVIKEAQKFASKGQFDKAIAEWRKLVKETPNDANIFNTIGDLCLKKNAKPEAVDAYKRAADILAEDGFTSKAIALYKKVLNIDPARIDVHLALGDMHADKGLVTNALENYKFVADFHKKQNKMGEALGVYQKMADLNAANVSFRIKLAEMYVREGMKREAVKAFLDAADVHIGKEAFQDARQLFERVLELDAANKEVYHKAGIVYYKEGKFVEASKAFKPAFESDPGNEELMNLYLDALDKAGRGGDADDVYRKILAGDPSRVDLREKVYRICLSRKEYDKALKEAILLAEHRADALDFAGAAGVLRELIAVTHDPVAAAGSLAAIFEKRGRAQEGAQELVAVADALIERGSRDDAREVLGKALLLSPGLAEAAQRIEQFGAKGAEAPVAAQDVVEEAVVPEAAPVPAAAPPRPPEEPVAELARPAESDDPALLEVLTEVDVLIKYGLGGQAIDQLEGLVRRFPDNAKARARLVDLCREQGKTDKAVLHSLMLAELFAAQGRAEESRSVLQTALELAPNNRQIMARLGMAAAPEQPPAAMPDAEIPEAIETIEEPEAIETLPEEVAAEVPELSVPELHLDAPLPDMEPLELHIPEVAEPVIAPEAEEPPPAVLPAEEAPEESFEEVFADVVAETAKPAAAPAPELPAADTAEIWAEAEFYYQQGLFDEAHRLYEQYLEHKPGDVKAQERIVEITREKEEVHEFSRLADAVDGLERAVAAGPEATEESVSPTDVNALRTLMQEINEMRRSKEPAAPLPEEAVTAERSSPGAGSESEETFADIAAELNGTASGTSADEPSVGEVDGEFFDLAAELRDELSGTAAAKSSVAANEQSLDDIFEEFKAGVEAHEKSEDEDTHYNLGVAYRDMGLLDDAVAEFSMANEGDPKFILSRYMLGLCNLEKGDFQTAITEIQNALGYSYSFGDVSEERIGMHYDLGLAFQGVGSVPAAMEEFQKVYNLDPAYRDVASKIQELQGGQFVSLDAIKEDIEREISFKFLEEGTRIEREEKTKKTKK